MKKIAILGRNKDKIWLNGLSVSDFHEIGLGGGRQIGIGCSLWEDVTK